ncbi:unnamed protein product [Peniophora sp. CBMAI 1063]|nr:unnamed protein product [Peniophora sp. CBMAI 1063]
MDMSTSLIELSSSWDQQLVAAVGGLNEAQAAEGVMLAAQSIARCYAERLNSFNVAVSLPAEILEAIFYAVKDALASKETSVTRSPQPLPPPQPYPGYPPYIPYTPPPQTHKETRNVFLSGAGWVSLTHVCRRWRQVALGCYGLWCDIDVNLYGTVICKEMLMRIGSRAFSLSADLQTHKELLLDVSLRERVPAQLSSLTLNMDLLMARPGAILDTLFSYIDGRTNPALRQLRMSGSSPQSISWSTLTPVLPSLTSLYLLYLAPRGHIPASLSMLTDLTLHKVDLMNHGPDGPDMSGFLKLISAMPVLESAVFLDCSFGHDPFIPENEILENASLPPTVRLAQFEANNDWTLPQCHALSRVLGQTTGDRVFKLNNLTNFHVAQTFALDVRAALDRGLYVHEVAIELIGWDSLDLSIEFRRAHSAAVEVQPLRVCFHGVSTRSIWHQFCDCITDIDTRDADLRIICDRSTPDMYNQDINILSGLRRMSVTSIYITGKLGSYIAAGLFTALRESDPDDEADGDAIVLAFPRLRDIGIECPPQAIVEETNVNVGAADMLTKDLDEAALLLLWYARARHLCGAKPLRTAALPVDLMHKRWVAELDDLLEDKVVPYDTFMKKESEVDCRALVLYRPVLRALAFWETWLWAITPLIGTLGIIWSSSRRR